MAATALIELADATAWADTTSGKFPGMSQLDAALVAAIQSQVLSQLANIYPVVKWIDVASTPTLVKSIIGMLYTASMYDRVYANDDDTSNYATRLQDAAAKLLQGLISGNLALTDLPAIDATTTQLPAFYPTNASSVLEPTVDNPSLGPAVFSMGTLW